MFRFIRFKYLYNYCDLLQYLFLQKEITIIILQKITFYYYIFIIMAGGPGLEPGLTGSKPAVLPIKLSPNKLIILHFFNF